MNAVPTDTASLPAPPPIDEVRWAEPTSRLPLRWGTYGLRYAIGLGLLVGATLVTDWRYWSEAWVDYPLTVDRLLSRTAVSFLVVGVVLAAALLVMPARSGRRWLAGAILLSVYGCWGFVDGWGFSGSAALATAVLVVLAWLILRERSGVGYAVALPVAVVVEYLVWRLGTSGSLPDLGLNGWSWLALDLLGWVGAAWLARAVEPRFSVRRTGREAAREDVRERTQAATAARGIDEQVRQMAELQAAWERAHPGQPMPAVAAPMLARSGGTNTLAILALVFGIIGGGVVPVILGHLARAQIRRTGEAGDGMAVAGLVLGYLGIAILVGYLVFVVGLVNSLS